MKNHKGIMPRGLPLGAFRVLTLLINVILGLSYLFGGMAEAASPLTPSFSKEVSLVPYDQQSRVQGGPSWGKDGNGNLYALWVDYRNGHPDIYFAYRPAGGNWGINIRVNDDAAATWRGAPAIATDGTGKAYVIWEDQGNGSSHLYFSTFSSPTTFWITPAKMRVDDEKSVRPSNPTLCFYSPGGAVIAAWEDERNGNTDIYGAILSTDPAGTWGANVKINDDTGDAEQRHPQVAAKGYYLLYIWEDYRNGDADIYSYSPPLLGSRPNERVNGDPGGADQFNPSVFVNETDAYAVWVEVRNVGNAINYSHRNIVGAWGNILLPQVGCQFSTPYNPKIVADSEIYILFEDSNNGDPDIFFASSLKDCARVHDDPLGTVRQTQPSLAVDRNGNAMALWSGFANEVGGVYSHTRPSGGSWGSYTLVSELAYFTQTSIALNQNNNAYALLKGERILFSYKSAGNPWANLGEVSTGTNLVSSPDIALDPSGNAYAIWAETNPTGGKDISFAYRPAGGVWGANIKVNDDSVTSYKGNPAIAVDRFGNALAVWQDHRNGLGAIFASYRPGGGSWGPNVQVNVSTEKAAYPAVALDGAGNAYAIWPCQPQGSPILDICFAYRPFQGSWGSPEKINSDSSWNGSPDIAVDEQGNAFAVWVSNQTMVFSHRPCGGSWSGPFQVSTDTTSEKGNSRIALDGKQNIYILWEDIRYGSSSPAIFFSYAHGPVNELFLPLVNK